MNIKTQSLTNSKLWAFLVTGIDLLSLWTNKIAGQFVGFLFIFTKKVGFIRVNVLSTGVLHAKVLFQMLRLNSKKCLLIFGTFVIKLREQMIILNLQQQDQKPCWAIPLLLSIQKTRDIQPLLAKTSFCQFLTSLFQSLQMIMLKPTLGLVLSKSHQRMIQMTLRLGKDTICL